MRHITPRAPVRQLQPTVRDHAWLVGAAPVCRRAEPARDGERAVQDPALHPSEARWVTRVKPSGRPPGRLARVPFAL